MNKWMSEEETPGTYWMNEVEWREVLPLSQHVLTIYSIKYLVSPHSLQVLPLHNVYTTIPFPEVFYCYEVLISAWPPLRGRTELSSNTGALLLEITFPRYTKGLGRVERAWTFEPEDLCVGLFFFFFCPLVSLWTWTNQVICFLTLTWGCYEGKCNNIMVSALWIVKSLEMFIVLSGSGKECGLWLTRIGVGSSHTNTIIYSFTWFYCFS